MDCTLKSLSSKILSFLNDSNKLKLYVAEHCSVMKKNSHFSKCGESSRGFTETLSGKCAQKKDKDGSLSPYLSVLISKSSLPQSSNSIVLPACVTWLPWAAACEGRSFILGGGVNFFAR